MTQFNVSSFSFGVLVLLSFVACGDSVAAPEGGASAQNAAPSQPVEEWQPPKAAGPTSQTAGAAASMPSMSTGGARAGAGAPTSSGMTTAASAGAQAAMAAAGSGGAPSAAAVGAAGSPASAGSSASGAAAGASGAAAGVAGMGSATDSKAFAEGLSELFIDAACDSATRAPLEEGATCNHPPNTQRIEKMVTFGGEAGKSYKVTLRVRGIWEPTSIMGGMRPSEEMPFTIGGAITSGAGSSSDSINYQQYFIEVAEPKQTYWLNDYQYVAHDIHKEDYEASITVGGGSQIKVVMNDGNEREIANFPKEMFTDIPPYDKMPSLGQTLRLDVVSVEAAP